MLSNNYIADRTNQAYISSSPLRQSPKSTAALTIKIASNEDLKLQTQMDKLKANHESTLLKLMYQKEELERQREVRLLKFELDKELAIEMEEAKMQVQTLKKNAAQMINIDWPSLRMTVYDPLRGFNITWDYLTGIHEAAAKSIQVTFALFDGPSSIRQPIILELAPVYDQDGQYALQGGLSSRLSGAHRFTGISAATTTRIIVDLRAFNINHEFEGCGIPIGWGAFELFDTRLQFLSGDW